MLYDNSNGMIQELVTVDKSPFKQVPECSFV